LIHDKTVKIDYSGTQLLRATFSFQRVLYDNIMILEYLGNTLLYYSIIYSTNGQEKHQLTHLDDSTFFAAENYTITNEHVPYIDSPKFKAVPYCIKLIYLMISD
jgi:hypothetical protein